LQYLWFRVFYLVLNVLQWDTKVSLKPNLFDYINNSNTAKQWQTNYMKCALIAVGAMWCTHLHNYTPTNSYTYIHTLHLVVAVEGLCRLCTEGDVGQNNLIIKIGLLEIMVFPPSNKLIGFSPKSLILLILFIQVLKKYWR
jgi:hypothetical protein